jgi:hypothetical protein
MLRAIACCGGSLCFRWDITDRGLFASKDRVCARVVLWQDQDAGQEEDMGLDFAMADRLDLG